MHREIWEHHHGPIPKGVQIDHIDGNSLNNRVENLRLATNAENSRNRKLQPNNSSGAAGVRKRSSGRWDARIGSSSHGTMKYIGSFTTKAEAIAARMEVEAQMFGQFTRSNP